MSDFMLFEVQDKTNEAGKVISGFKFKGLNMYIYAY